MKKLLLLAAVATVLLPIVTHLKAQSADSEPTDAKVAMFSEAKTPEGFPPVTAIGEIAVKEYPEYRAARVTDSKGRSGMFRTLFQHIKSNNIAMTAPVEMNFDEKGPTSMAFLYGSTEIGETGKGEKVEVVDIPAMTVVSVGVRGEYSKANFEANRKKLEGWLAEHADEWTAAGTARYFAFNSPFVPGLLKYGEVQIPIKVVEANGTSD